MKRERAERADRGLEAAEAGGTKGPSAPGSDVTGKITVDVAQFPSLKPPGLRDEDGRGAFGGSPRAGGMRLLLDVPLEIAVELGRNKKPLRDVMGLGPGSVVELDKQAGDPVDVLVNGKLVARGEVVVVEENFGVRITQLVVDPEGETSS